MKTFSDAFCFLVCRPSDCLSTQNPGHGSKSPYKNAVTFQRAPNLKLPFSSEKFMPVSSKSTQGFTLMKPDEGRTVAMKATVGKFTCSYLG